MAGASGTEIRRGGESLVHGAIGVCICYTQGTTEGGQNTQKEFEKVGNNKTLQKREKLESGGPLRVIQG